MFCTAEPYRVVDLECKKILSVFIWDQAAIGSLISLLFSPLIRFVAWDKLDEKEGSVDIWWWWINVHFCHISPSSVYHLSAFGDIRFFGIILFKRSYDLRSGVSEAHLISFRLMNNRCFDSIKNTFSTMSSSSKRLSTISPALRH